MTSIFARTGLSLTLAAAMTMSATVSAAPPAEAQSTSAVSHQINAPGGSAGGTPARAATLATGQSASTNRSADPDPDSSWVPVPTGKSPDASTEFQVETPGPGSEKVAVDLYTGFTRTNQPVKETPGDTYRKIGDIRTTDKKGISTDFDITADIDNLKRDFNKDGIKDRRIDIRLVKNNASLADIGRSGKQDLCDAAAWAAMATVAAGALIFFSAAAVPAAGLTIMGLPVAAGVVSNIGAGTATFGTVLKFARDAGCGGNLDGKNGWKN